MARQANWDDMYAVVKWHSQEFAAAVQNQWGFTPEKFSILVDRKGVRVEISIQLEQVPGFEKMTAVQYILAGELIEIPIEIREDEELMTLQEGTRYRRISWERELVDDLTRGVG